MSDSAGTAAAARGDDRPRRTAGSAAIGLPRVTRHRRGPLTLLRAIAVFYRQVVAELRKVIWPTRKELVTYTTVVLFFVVVMVLVVSAFDFAFSQAVLKVFGGSTTTTP